MPPTDPLRPYDLPRVLLAVLTLVILIAGTGWVMRPFLLALVWATMITVSSWPILEWFQRRFRGRRAPAVAVMVVMLLLLLVVPLSLTITTIAENADRISEALRDAASMTLPAPPEWLGKVPLVGAKLEAAWVALAASGPGALGAAAAPYGREVLRWLGSQAASFGGTLVEFLLTVLIAGILFSSGEAAASGVRRFFRRLAGERGENTVELAGKAVRAVALGVVVTALVQSALAGLGLWIAGVPRPGLLTALSLVLCIAQVGPILVLGPSVIWLYWSGSTGWATALLVWSVGVGTIDNVLRPVLIRKGADLPLLLIFAGVIGGLIGFGVVGLFIGPAILAVAYTLTTSWIAELDQEPAAPEA
jgi:predicted PurR-regulated permease PerM